MKKRNWLEIAQLACDILFIAFWHPNSNLAQLETSERIPVIFFTRTLIKRINSMRAALNGVEIVNSPPSKEASRLYTLLVENFDKARHA